MIMKKMIRFYVVAFMLMLASLPTEVLAADGTVKKEKTDGLVVYYPAFNSIDLACGSMPNGSNKRDIMCCAAAFTATIRDGFDHSNICGRHVSGGKYYNGTAAGACTGCFAYYADNGTWKFEMGAGRQTALKNAATRGGMGFSQAMIIFKGKAVVNVNLKKRNPVTPGNVSQYRALAEKNGRLCIVDAEKNMTYKTFVQKLVALGVSNAIYMDMGTGWNYSWYRDNNGKIVHIHSIRIPYTTNWIVFRK